jgi:hypothetical protein
MSNNRRTTRSRGHELSEAAWAFLNDALTDEIGKPWERYGLDWNQPMFSGGMRNRMLWDIYGAHVLKRWIVEHPGTRPSLWWRYEAPRQSSNEDGFWAGRLPEPRRRLGGSGRPLHETLAYVPEFYLGVPALWPLGDELLIGPDCVPIDRRDPPMFEAQAVYLERAGLLSSAESRRSNSEPESVLDILANRRSGANDMTEIDISDVADE